MSTENNDKTINDQYQDHENIPSSSNRNTLAIAKAVSIREDILRACDTLIEAKARFQVKHAEYGENQWTMPVELNEHRIRTIIDDRTIKQVRITIDMP